MDLIGTAVFKDRVRKLEPSDPAIPETWDPIHQDLVNNDVWLKNKVEQLSVESSHGESNFASTNGATVIHSLGSTDYMVSVIPLADTGGDLGDVYVTKAANAFTVYNTGGFTGLFRWQMSV